MKEDADYWFRAREFGYGVGIPLNWKGWALVIGLIAAMLLGQALIQRFIPQHDWAIAVVVGAVVVLGPLIWLMYVKTERGVADPGTD